MEDRPRRGIMPVWVALAVAGAAILACAGPSPEDLAATASVLESEEAALRATGTEYANETFEDPNAGIPVGTDQGVTTAVANGVYSVSFSGGGYGNIYLQDTLTNFIAEVDCTTVSGGGDAQCGIIFNLDPVGLEDRYFFYVSDGSYGFASAQGSSTSNSSLSNAAINATGTNRLRVIVNGGQAKLIVNDTLVDTKDVTAIPSGLVGIEGRSNNDSGGVEVTMDNFVVIQLP